MAKRWHHLVSWVCLEKRRELFTFPKTSSANTNDLTVDTTRKARPRCERFEQLTMDIKNWFFCLLTMNHGIDGWTVSFLPIGDQILTNQYSWETHETWTMTLKWFLNCGPRATCPRNTWKWSSNTSWNKVQNSQSVVSCDWLFSIRRWTITLSWELTTCKWTSYM